MRWKIIGMGLLIVTAVACGGGGDDSTSDPVNDAEPGSGSSGEVSATFTSGDVSLSATEASSCNFGSLLDVKAVNGDDWFSVFDSQGQVFIRAFIDGQEWVDNGSPDPPVVSGQTVTWSGDLSTQGEVRNAEISISC